MVPEHLVLAPKPLVMVPVLFEGGIQIIFYFACQPLAKFGLFFLWVITIPHTWQKLTKKTMGVIFKRIILTSGKNNYFEVRIIKMVFFETILLHISNYRLQICLVYDECINYGYYLMWFCIDIFFNSFQYMIWTNHIYYSWILLEPTSMFYFYNGKIIIIDRLLFWVEWAFLGAFHPSTSFIPLTSVLGAKIGCHGAITIIDLWLIGSKMGALRPP